MKRRILAMALAFTMVFSTGVVANAESSDSKALETAINAVKSVVTIPSTFSDFAQYSYENEVNGVKSTVWQLNWNMPNSKGSISATVDQNGNILNYYKWMNKEKYSYVTDLTSAEGKKAATAFLSKVMPKLAPSMVEIKEETVSTGGGPEPAMDLSLSSKTIAPGPVQSDNFQYTYRLHVNNIPVSFISATVSVDKTTKEVTSFNFNGTYDTEYTYTDATGMINEAAATQSYLKEIGINIEYFAHYNDKYKTIMTFPAYVLNNPSGKVIDAKTGKTASIYYDNGYGFYDMGGMAKAESASANTADRDPSLTKDEQAAVDNIAGIMNKADAEKIARTLPGINADMKVTSTNLYSNYYSKNEYTWNISFDNAYVSLNAKTGEITGYSLYKDTQGKGTKKLTVDAAQKIVDEFIAKMAPEKSKEVKYVNNPYYYTLTTTADAKILPIPNPIEDLNYNFNYARQVNGYNFSSNGISVSIDKTTGEISNYNLNWYNDVTFLPIGDAVSKEDAFKEFDKAGDYSLMYVRTGKNTATPVYDFVDKQQVMIHPASGIRLDWNGQPYQNAVPEYKDIKGHWAEKNILTLAENGYFLNSSGDSFNPNKNITQVDFFLYIYGQTNNIDNLYDNLYSQGVLTEAERNPLATVTRQQAAVYLVKMLGYDKLAQNSAMFNYTFKDKVADTYKGYIAIVDGLDIMNGDKNKLFNPTKTLTNAETAAIVYNYLKIK